MKKITAVMTAFIFFCACATAQKKEKEYEKFFSEIQVGLNLGKNNTGVKESAVDLNAKGVYGWLYWQVARNQPFKKPIGQSYEKLTQISLGFGKRVNLDPYNLKEEGKKMELDFGFGPSIGLIPEYMSIPKKSKMYYGGSLFGILEGNQLRAEISVSMMTLPPRTQYEWNNNLTFGEVDVTKFFNGFGLGLNFRLRSVKQSEKQIINQPFNGYTYTENQTSINPYVCYQKNYFIFRAGPVLKKYKNSSADLNNPQPNFWAENYPVGFSFGMIVNLKN
ncbi:MAG: hypothetical protein QG644_111 [Patescibacteria group bacterium]|nr:hypothetical protein [Patescibacteria group bacterium]